MGVVHAIPPVEKEPTVHVEKKPTLGAEHHPETKVRPGQLGAVARGSTDRRAPYGFKLNGDVTITSAVQACSDHLKTFQLDDVIAHVNKCDAPGTGPPGE